MFGKAEIFHRKYLAAHLWLKPSSQVRNVIENVWTFLTEVDGSYMSVHIRRGDKITSGEAANFPVVLYYRALRRLCSASGGNSCSKTVFLWGDGNEELLEFKRLAGSCFRVVMWKDLYGLPVLENLEPRILAREHFQAEFDRLEAEERSKMAKMLMASLQIAVMADYAVCTLTSNLCKMTAVMRGGKMSENGVVSLDVQDWNIK